MTETSLPTVVATTLLQTMVHLDLHDDADWTETEAQAVARLSDAGDPAEVLAAMVKVSMILDQFLLEIASRPSEGRPRSAVISSAGRLVRDLLHPAADQPRAASEPMDAVRAYGVEIYSFGRYSVDSGSRTIRADGAPVTLRTPHRNLLLTLLVNRDRVVGHDELRRAAGTGLSDHPDALTSAINTLRKHLGDTGSRHHTIRTASGRGYQFIAPVHLWRRTKDDDDTH